ncbi:MAG: 2-hydroxyacyl-CoA dehydratase family protein [Spongiibacteraceae bacterium]|jgi:hypothetical protein|nr:2-hydroxyacyl-CoA dehydratase family protein [Spongiibacteraceae bacterium]
MSSAIDTLLAAAEDAGARARQLLAQGAQVVRVVGQDAPYELLRAAGLQPVRLVPRPGEPTPLADRLIGAATISQRGRSLLEQILNDDSGTPLLITHADAELPQLFGALRELLRTGEMAARPLHFLDLLHQPRTSSRRYNAVRLEQLARWLGDIGGSALTEARWREEHRCIAQSAGLLQRAQQLRTSLQLAGSELLAMIAALHVLPQAEWQELMAAALNEAGAKPVRDATAVAVAGSAQYQPDHYRTLEQAGFHIVCDLQDWGDPLALLPAGQGDWLTVLSEPHRRVPLRLQPFAQRWAALQQSMRLAGAGTLICLMAPADEPVAWDAGIFMRQASDAGLRGGVWRTDEPLRDAAELFAPPATGPAEPEPAQREPVKRRPRDGAGQRSTKSLQSVADFGSYQRSWFQQVRQQAQDGPFGVVNANSPQEMLRAMGLPFVVNQWWAAIAAAKQQSPRYFQLLAERGYPTDAEAYSAQGLAALFDADATQAPWGGLPRPDFLQAVLTTNATPRIFDHWSRASGADLFLFEHTVDPRLDIRADWWERLPDHWDEEIEAARLDLLTAELRQAIAQLEQQTGHQLDAAQFEEIMQLVNEQEEYYRLTRDLIAATRPAPVSIVDTMPATMVPQWHRGTIWGRDAARTFYEEVKSRATAGEAACPDERLRLMWLGRGLWGDMGFYQRWEQSHGAVFVWSMYLALAADGYIRYFDRGRDPLRALAARFVTMGDELRMPTWAGAWHVREAQTHGIHGAVALSDADPFVVRALERAGVPVLALDLDNYAEAAESRSHYDARISAFLDGLG